MGKCLPTSPFLPASPRSPKLNAYAQSWVRSEACTFRNGQEQLSRQVCAGNSLLRNEVLVLQKQILVHQARDIRQQTSPLIAVHANRPSSQVVFYRMFKYFALRLRKTLESLPKKLYFEWVKFRQQVAPSRSRRRFPIPAGRMRHEVRRESSARWA